MRNCPSLNVVRVIHSFFCQEVEARGKKGITTNLLIKTIHKNFFQSLPISQEIVERVTCKDWSATTIGKPPPVFNPDEFKKVL
jgi:hypothetical protein